jgi:hypothetical protein
MGPGLPDIRTLHHSGSLPAHLRSAGPSDRDNCRYVGSAPSALGRPLCRPGRPVHPASTEGLLVRPVLRPESASRTSDYREMPSNPRAPEAAFPAASGWRAVLGSYLSARSYRDCSTPVVLRRKQPRKELITACIGKIPWGGDSKDPDKHHVISSRNANMGAPYYLGTVHRYITSSLGTKFPFDHANLSIHVTEGILEML